MKTKTRISLWCGGAALAVTLVAAAQVPIKGLIVDAIQGFTVNGAAPSGQVVCGNGSAGVFSASCPINAHSADVASSLAATPTQCSGSQPLASGIQANGNANCTVAHVQGVLTNLTGSRSSGSVYQNTSGGTLLLSGYVSTTGSSTGTVYCKVGVDAGVSMTVWRNTVTATIESGSAGFNCTVPNGYFYEITGDGAVGGITGWFETTL